MKNYREWIFIYEKKKKKKVHNPGDTKVHKNNWIWKRERAYLSWYASIIIIFFIVTSQPLLLSLSLSLMGSSCSRLGSRYSRPRTSRNTNHSTLSSFMCGGSTSRATYEVLSSSSSFSSRPKSIINTHFVFSSFCQFGSRIRILWLLDDLGFSYWVHGRSHIWKSRKNKFSSENLTFFFSRWGNISSNWVDHLKKKKKE